MYFRKKKLIYCKSQLKLLKKSPKTKKDIKKKRQKQDINSYYVEIVAPKTLLYNSPFFNWISPFDFYNSTSDERLFLLSYLQSRFSLEEWKTLPPDLRLSYIAQSKVRLFEWKKLRSDYPQLLLDLYLHLFKIHRQLSLPFLSRHRPLKFKYLSFYFSLTFRCFCKVIYLYRHL